MALDPEKLLANDPLTTFLFLHVTRKWVVKFFADEDRIASVVQEALADMIARLNDGEEPEPKRIVYWIFARAHNAVRRELTRMQYRLATEPFESELHGQALVDLSRTFRLRDEIARVQEVLEGYDDRTLTILHERIRGLTYREIADNLGLGAGAARESVSQLRKRLVDDLTTREKVEHLMRLAEYFHFVREPSTPPTKPDGS